VAKTCPNCKYSPIGPFTDNCPICGEPVRNARGGGGGIVPASGMPPWVQWVLGGVLVALLLVGGCCAVGMWRLNTAFDEAREAMEQAEARAVADRKARTVAVSAADLVREFAADPAAADRTYKGRYLEVTGVVERVGTDGDGTPFVILHGGDAAAAVRVECFFDFADERAEGRVGRLAAGRRVTIRGEYDGRVSNVQVRECELVE
jgi:hypothetical protein